jgi:hypothetical protein
LIHIKVAVARPLFSAGSNHLRGEPMSGHYHAIVWIDHLEARVFHFNADEMDRLVLHPHDPTRHIHHRVNTTGSGHAADDHQFFAEVVDAIAAAEAVLVTGPANTKTALMKHILDHKPRLLNVIRGVETVDHPTDRELLAHARRFFKADDRMHAQRS